MTNWEWITAATISARYAQQNCHLHDILQYNQNDKQKSKFDTRFGRKHEQFGSPFGHIQKNEACVPKLAALAKLFDDPFGRYHEAHRARRTIRCYLRCYLRSHTDK